MSDYRPQKMIPGTVYQVVRLLGQGGMGTVYEVEDTTVGKRYVLKTLHAELRDRKELAARINKEARILARLSHPNIVEVVTAGMTGDSLRLPYFLMQKLNGHTLRAVLAAKARLPLETAYAIAIDLLDALDHAHGMGVIHRDVKPENIFLHRGPGGAHQTKLLDFGVMRMLSGDQPQTGGRFVGTLRYAPPEQLRGGEITPRTDLYATGLVLYEMLAGSGPFDDQTTDREIANAHLDKAPPPLSSRIDVSPELDALVQSALSKDPAARPRDAFTFAAKLRALSRAAAMRENRPSAAPLPTGTLRLPAAPPSGAIERSAPTRTPAPIAPRPVAFPAPEPLRDAATTMGAISSHAGALPQRKPGAVLLTAAMAVALVIGGIALMTQWTKAHPKTRTTAVLPAPSASATTPPTLTPTLTPAPTPASTSTSAPTSTPAPPSLPPPTLARHPASRPPPAPRAATPPAPAPPAPGKPRLPGPGF